MYVQTTVFLGDKEQYCSGFGIAQDFEETPLLFPPQDEWPGGTFFPSPYSQVDKCYTPLSNPNQRDRLQEVDYVCRWKRGEGGWHTAIGGEERGGLDCTDQ